MSNSMIADIHLVSLYDRGPGKPGFTCETSVLPNDYPSHIHDYYEIEYVRHGTGTNFVNGRAEQMCPGYIYVITPRDLHRIKVEGKMLITNIKVKSETGVKGLAEILGRCGGFVSAVLSEDECKVAEGILSKVEALYGDLDQNGREKGLTMLHIGNLMSALISILMLEGKGCEELAVGDRRATEGIQLSMKYINENFTDPITLNDVVKVSGYSKCYFSSLFSKFVGMSFVEYLQRVRLGYAANLLRTTNENISVIAFESGFGSISQFVRTYKSLYGMPPGDERKGSR